MSSLGRQMYRTFPSVIWRNGHKLHGQFGPSGLILGIESSCDESAIAVLEPKSVQIIASAVASQWQITHTHKGVFPKLAAREQQRNLPILLQQTINQLKDFKGNVPANENFSPVGEMKLDLELRSDGPAEEEVDALIDSIDFSPFEVMAVTTGPGLSLCLQEGLNLAKKIVKKNSHLRFVAVNHLEAHILVSKLTCPELEFPFIALLISGGNTVLCAVKDIGEYEILATTVDDAIGEAFDKVAVMLGLGLEPNESFGAAVERYAKDGETNAIAFQIPVHGKQYRKKFSFSGLKSAVRREIMIRSHDGTEKLTKKEKADIALAFQTAAIQQLVKRLNDHYPDLKSQEVIRHIVVCGGTACNQSLRSVLSNWCSSHQMELVCPPVRHCTDNAEMIAYTGFVKASLGHDDPITLGFSDRWSLA